MGRRGKEQALHFLGLYSVAEGATAILLSEDGVRLAKAHKSCDGSVIQTALEAAKTCLEAVSPRNYYACLSLANFADGVPVGALPGNLGLSLCKPQEALLAGTLGGRPGVVVQSADAFRGLGVDDEGTVKGLAQNEGARPWMIRRLRQLQRLEPEKFAEAASYSPEDCADLLEEAVDSMVVLLLHLIPQLSLRYAASISCVGAGMVPPLTTLLQNRLEKHVCGLTWIEPEMSPAEGCAWFARAAAISGKEGVIDRAVWMSLFHLSTHRRTSSL